MSTLEERGDSGDNNNNSNNNNIESNVTNMRHLTRLIYDMSKYTILITFAVISSIILIIIPILIIPVTVKGVYIKQKAALVFWHWIILLIVFVWYYNLNIVNVYTKKYVLNVILNVKIDIQMK